LPVLTGTSAKVVVVTAPAPYPPKSKESGCGVSIVTVIVAGTLARPLRALLEPVGEKKTA
jgi:hypothetical protein